MKKIIWALAALIFMVFLTVQLQGQDKNWGLGIRLGDPTGITAKKYMGSNNALELALGGHNLDHGGLQFLVHYLFHFPVANAPGLDWYYGFGGQIDDDHHDHHDRGRDNDTEFGADGVIGMEYTFAQGRLAAFVDAILFVELIDDPFDLELDAGIGLRYNF